MGIRVDSNLFARLQLLMEINGPASVVARICSRAFANIGAKFEARLDIDSLGEGFAGVLIASAFRSGYFDAVFTGSVPATGIPSFSIDRSKTIVLPKTSCIQVG